MAKSTRSKVKRAYRAKKRETGVYAAAEAARLHRLNAKLSQIVTSSDTGARNASVTEGGIRVDDDAIADDGSKWEKQQIDSTPIAHDDTPRIPTHGCRNSRREEWRGSKGMALRRARKGTVWDSSAKKRR